MTSSKKTKAKTLFRYVILVELLREDEFPADASLSEMIDDGVNGDSSMDWELSSYELVDEDRAIEICKKHRTDTSFLGLDSEDED